MKYIKLFIAIMIVIISLPIAIIIFLFYSGFNTAKITSDFINDL